MKPDLTFTWKKYADEVAKMFYKICSVGIPQLDTVKYAYTIKSSFWFPDAKSRADSPRKDWDSMTRSSIKMWTYFRSSVLDHWKREKIRNGETYYGKLEGYLESKWYRSFAFLSDVVFIFVNFLWKYIGNKVINNFSLENNDKS